MTCIVALMDGPDVYMGGDSAGVAGLSMQIRSDDKVFRNGPMVFGFTSSFRMGQLLRYKLVVPENKSPTPYAFMCTAFIDTVRKCLSKGGYAKKENEVEEGGTFLVGYRGAIYCIGGDFQVGALACEYHSVGCGSAYAKGVMFATRDIEIAPRNRVREALKAAVAFSAGVRPPFKIIKLPGKHGKDKGNK